MLEIGRPVPRAPLEVAGGERLGGGARGTDLGLFQDDGQSDAAEAVNEGEEEAANGWGGTRAETFIEKKGAEIDAFW